MLATHLSGEHIILAPGGYFVSEKSVLVSTLLGSCVSVCLWDEPNRIIGMNHFLLAHRPCVKTEPSCHADAGRYGTQAMALLIDGMTKLGARRENLRAKAFGGASIMGKSHGRNGFCVGEVNSRFIVDFLKTDGIPLIAHDLGGALARVVHFFSDDFSVYYRRMPVALHDKIVKRRQGLWRTSIKKEEVV